jgi:hypothetical protein
MTIASRCALLVALSLASICSSINSTAVAQNPTLAISPDTASSGPKLVVERDDLLKAKDGLPGFRITLLNPGRKDLVLNIGMLLANGNKQYASAIELLLTDPRGKTWKFPAGDPGSIAGRIDPFVLPLPAGASFTLPLNLDDDWAFRAVTADAKLTGPCTIKARYSGKGVSMSQAYLDSKGVSLMPYWMGTVESNEVPFEALGKN